MILSLPKIWLGTEDSYANLYDRLLAYHENPAGAQLQLAEMRADYDDDDEEPFDFYEFMASQLIENYGGTAVISVKGSLVDDESPFNAYFGAVGYPTIVRALNQALDDEDTHSVIMAYATPGGSASGVSETGDAIAAANKVKPVTAHTGNMALSAGYWLATSAPKIRTTKMGELGSIGAIATYMSVVRMLKERGIDPYIARSTPQKAVPHPYEKLSDTGKKVLDEDIARLGGFFQDQVLANRPNLSSANAQKTWASGRTWYGEESINMGLADGPLVTLGELIAQTNETYDNSLQTLDEDPTMPQRIVLNSEQARAKLASGGALAELTTTQEINEPSDPNDPVAASAAAPVADANLAAGDPAPAQPVVEGAVELAADPAPKEDGLTAYLRDEIKELKEANAKLTADLATAQSDLGLANQRADGLEQLRPVAEASIERLQVGLGHRAMRLEGLPVDSLVAVYDQLNAELMALPVGVQSSQENTSRDEPSADEDNSLQAQRLRLIPTSA